jgi:hypothetical protein
MKKSTITIITLTLVSLLLLMPACGYDLERPLSVPTDDGPSGTSPLALAPDSEPAVAAESEPASAPKSEPSYNQPYRRAHGRRAW